MTSGYAPISKRETFPGAPSFGIKDAGDDPDRRKGVVGEVIALTNATLKIVPKVRIYDDFRF